MNRTRLLFLSLPFLAFTAGAQNFDTSGNGTLKGDYFVREVLIAGQNANGTVTSASSTIGVATFDGAGNYKYAGQGTTTASVGLVKSQTSTGTYQLSANGLLIMTSLLGTNDACYGGLSAVGPAAFVASATESTNVDILIAIPAGASASNATFKGAYTAGYIDFLNADINMVREATFNLSADGGGNLGNVSVAGTAVNLGNKATTQTVSNATYTLAGAGAGTINLGASSSAQLVSGTKNFYISSDGGIVLGGSPGGFDLMVGIRALASPATNSTAAGLYYIAGLEDIVTVGTSSTTHGIEAYYGSTNSNGLGTSINHNRLNSFANPVVDYTYDAEYTVPASGIYSDGFTYQYALGDGGKAFIATGQSGFYSLVVGLGTPVYASTGTAPFLNPVGVVNGASFAPITNPVAPNEVVTLYGSNLASGTASATSVPLPKTLGNNVQVTVNGIQAPLFYVTPNQIALLVPQAITPAAPNNVFNATFQVINNGVKSNPVTVYTSQTAPGIFSAGGNAIGPAAAQHGVGLSLITSANPAKPGETIVLYASGLGAVSPAVGDGAPGPSGPLAMTSDTDVVDFGGTPGNVAFNGLTPGLAGLYQLNTTLDKTTASGVLYVNISTPDAYTSESSISVAGATSASDRPQARANGRLVLNSRTPARNVREQSGLNRRAQ